MRVLICVALFSALAVPALAGDSADGQAGVGLAVPTPDPSRLKADELDRLFGELHRERANRSVEQKIWAKWAENPSPTAELLLTQASRAMSDGALDASETILDDLINSYPEYVEALNRRATLYYRLKRYDDSLADVEKVLEVEPRHFGALAAKGMVLEAQGKLAKAAEAYRDALAVNPHMETVAAALKQLEHDAPDI